MIRRVAWLILLLLLQAGALDPARAQQQPADPQPPPQWMDTDRSTPSGTQYHAFFSRTIGDSVSCLLYLPPGYADHPDRRYPVVYWLHGLGGDQRTGARFALPPLDSAIRAGIAPPLIGVFVNGMRDSFYHDSPDGRWPVQRVIVHDLIPHIDATCRTVADRRARAIEGYSMGGFGAALLGFKYPDLFGAVSIMAGALLDVEQMAFRHAQLLRKTYGNDTTAYSNATPFRWAERNADSIRGRTRVRIAVGADDRLRPRNDLMDALLTRLRIDHDYQVVPGVGHSSRLFYEARGAAGFRFYTDAFRSIADATP